MTRKRRTIRYSDDEWERAAVRAECEDLPRTTYVREISTGDLDIGSKRSRQKIIAQLFRVGTYLKQVRERFDEASRQGGARGEDFEHDSIALGRVLDEVRGALGALGAYRGTDVPAGSTEPLSREPSEESSQTGREG